MIKNSTIFTKITVVLIATFFLGACDGAGQFHVKSLVVVPHEGLGGDLDEGDDFNGKDPDENPVQEPDGDSWVGLQICSELEFDGLDWAASLKTSHREPFALALNITGSFEGSNGFQNLTGNFDGQGISMGLLQWNLGQGSLQPIWNSMLSRYASQFKGELTSSQMSSVQGMLNRWNSYANSSALRIEDYGYNELDDPEKIAEALGVSLEDILLVTSALTARNQESVNWAKANILSGTSIKTDWANRLKKIAIASGYRSLQVERAQSLHSRAIGLLETYKMTQLRSYLVFFDIVVQNGSIPTKVYNSYHSWLASNKSANEYTRMKKLIELRVAESKPQWQADVRARKMTILDGVGTVHGSRRDLNKEYCASIQSPMP